MVRRHGCHLPAHPFQVQTKQQMCLVSKNTLFCLASISEKRGFLGATYLPKFPCPWRLFCQSLSKFADLENEVPANSIN